jgi:FAD/FMN-containing dehydrogenase
MVQHLGSVADGERCRYLVNGSACLNELGFEQKKQRLANELLSGGSSVGLYKEKSNLFRDREGKPTRKLNVADFNTVIKVDSDNGWVEVEGMTTYENLVNATLTHGVMPTVVPQLKSITIGGAVSGLGIEASSFKYGLVHETVLEMDVLVGDGQVVTCTPTNAYRDLFFGFPNSYGTLGYLLKLKAMTVPVKPYVQIKHLHYRDTERYFRDLDAHCRKREADFIDGVVFAPDELYLTLGIFTDEAPLTSDYTFEHIYYRSIREKLIDYLTTLDYLWRWDTDWFWCSKNLCLQNPILRRIVGKARLNSVTYTKLMRWNSRWQLTKRFHRLLGIHTESIIQDVDIPLANAPAFLDFFHREIGITPIWICPFRVYHPEHRFDLYPVDPNTVYVNFGFWDVVSSREGRPPGYYNRKVEAKVTELGGIKSLYSDSFFTPEEFWKIYNKPTYDQLKAKYDPQGVFKDLYQKTVLRA